MEDYVISVKYFDILYFFLFIYIIFSYVYCFYSIKIEDTKIIKDEAFVLFCLLIWTLSPIFVTLKFFVDFCDLLCYLKQKVTLNNKHFSCKENRIKENV